MALAIGVCLDAHDTHSYAVAHCLTEHFDAKLFEQQ
jgi:hypothetical protein